jgi:hypothetical protein
MPDKTINKITYIPRYIIKADGQLGGIPKSPRIHNVASNGITSILNIIEIRPAVIELKYEGGQTDRQRSTLFYAQHSKDSHYVYQK